MEILKWIFGALGLGKLGFMKNVSSDTLTTYLGLIECAIATMLTYMATGFDPQNPIAWAGMVYAVVTAVRGYYTNKIAKAGPPDPVADVAVKSGLLLLLVFVLASCTQQDTSKLQKVLLSVNSEAQTIVVTGCATAPTVELAANTVLPLLPPGTTLDAVKAGVALAEPQINAICAAIKQQQAPKTN